MKYFASVFLGVAAVAMSIVSCSTKKNTWSSRQYHNLTARFNVNFNAKESFKDAEKKTEAIYPSTFDELLPVFAFTYSDAPGVATSELDRTITKSNKLITRHSIKAKPKRKNSPTAADRKFYNKREFCDMVDDAYLFIGKSRMYSQQYDEAVFTFQSIVSNYPDENTVDEAKLWLAVIHIERGELDQAEEGLLAIEKKLKKSKENPPQRFIQAVNSAWADFYIKKGDYSEAIPKLTAALKRCKYKTTKARYSFILAQLYERAGNNAMATNYYNKVAKMNVPYEVEFSALMSRANTMDSKTQADDLRRLYTKMVSDEKNAEFIDQIYYALGNLERVQGDTARAVEYYQKSLAGYKGNDVQRGLSSLALANSYYAKQAYLPAYYYYDTATTSLAQTHSQYTYAELMANKLRALGISLAVVEREDSLQKIAKMPEEERRKFAASLAKKAEEQEKALQQPTQNYYDYQYTMQQTQRVAQSSGAASSQWYFYNPMAINQGMAFFKVRWGQRKLEDSWRRKNKRATVSESTVADELLADVSGADSLANGSSARAAELSPLTPEYYLQDVPLTEDAMKASNNRLMTALYNAAVAYRIDMKDDKRSLATFEELLTRFPQNEYLPSVYYNMYQLLSQNGETDKANSYKALLAAEYPQDKLTLSVQNPNYAADVNRLENEAEQRYENALANYKVGNNAAALNIINTALVDYKGLSVEPNFALLKVLTTSYDSNVAGYKQALQQVVKTYPSTSAAATAQNLLSIVEKEEARLLNSGTGSTTAPTSTGTAPATRATPAASPPVSQPIVLEPLNVTDSAYYTLSDTEPHVFLLVVNKETTLMQLSFDFALYNADHYLNKNYEVFEESNIDSNRKALLIKTFNTKQEAMTYYNGVVNESLLLGSMATDSYLCMVISPSNLDKLKAHSALSDYVQFFKQNYLNNSNR